MQEYLNPVKVKWKKVVAQAEVQTHLTPALAASEGVSAHSCGFVQVHLYVCYIVLLEAPSWIQSARQKNSLNLA